MSKFVTTIKRAFGSNYGEPPVHFHQGTSDDNVEVCHDGACARPHLMTIPFPTR